MSAVLGTALLCALCICGTLAGACAFLGVCACLGGTIKWQEPEEQPGVRK